MTVSAWRSLGALLAVNRTVGVVLVSLLFFGLGEQLWSPFFPAYLVILAFVVYGMREIGEPARKALITSLVPKAVRAEGVGLYWGLRSVAVCWASLVGALAWYAFGPGSLLYLAFAFGCAGAAIFYCLVRENAGRAPAVAGSTGRRA